MKDPIIFPCDREPDAPPPQPRDGFTEEVEEITRLVFEISPQTVTEVRRPSQRKVGIALGLFALGLVGLASLSVGDWLLDLADRHWAMAAVGGLFVGATVFGALVLGGRELAALAHLKNVDELHVRAASIKDSGEAFKLMEDVASTLATSADLSKWREAAKSCDAAGVTAQFNRQLLEPLDQKALQLVKRAAADAAMLVALSPTILTDTAIFFARSASLISGIASVYGHRPGKLTSIALMRRMMREVGVVAATDVLGDSMTTVASEVVGKAIGKVTVAAGEGIVAGQRMARIGFMAMSVCRPLPFPEGRRPKLSDLLRN
jgi:putative membrane protein